MNVKVMLDAHMPHPFALEHGNMPGVTIYVSCGCMLLTCVYLSYLYVCGH
jgi:hypothetical protein